MIYTPDKKSLYVHVWSNYKLTDILSLLRFHKPKLFIFDCSTEYEPNPNFSAYQELDELNQYIKVNNIESYMLLASYSIYEYPINKQPEDILPDFNFITYPLAFCYRAYEYLNYKDINTYPTHLFYALINRPHFHRCILVDQITKTKLDRYGKFTWNLLTKEYHQTEYKFEYWKEKRIAEETSGFIDNPEDPYHIPDQQYFSSVFDLVVESTIETTFFTEKTFKPILIGKPFLIFGAHKIHANLTELGFQLYDEVIDYSFDSIEDTKERAVALCLELKRIALNYKLEDIRKLLKAKVKDNKVLANYYAKDKTKVAKEFVEKYVHGIR